MSGCKLEIKSEVGDLPKVILDGHDCTSHIYSLSLEMSPDEIPMAKIEVAPVEMLAAVDAQVYFDHTVELSRALLEVMPEKSAFWAMETAQKIMYRMATRE